MVTITTANAPAVPEIYLTTPSLTSVAFHRTCAAIKTTYAEWLLNKRASRPGRGFDDAFALPRGEWDLVIQCGDLTQESKIEEFRVTLGMMRAIEAGVKVVIAGNHEITLEEDTYKKLLASAGVRTTDDAAVKAFGKLGEARDLLLAAKEDGIVFLEEGTHTLTLPNGATICLYANPWTPKKEGYASLGSQEANWAFQYDPSEAHSHYRALQDQHPDIIVTHGPPAGVLDRIPQESSRAGSPELFAAVARGKPLLHCFGHIHVGWGARLVTWQRDTGEKPTHFEAINNEESSTLEGLAGIKPGRIDDEQTKLEKKQNLTKMLAQGYCQLEPKIQPGKQTLFVNAAVEGDEEVPIKPPFSVTLDLPRTVSPEDNNK